MKDEAVMVTGMGFVTCIGRSRADVTAHLKNGRHGFSRVDLRPGLDLPIKIAGIVDGYTFSSPSPGDWHFPEDSAVAPDEVTAFPPHGIYAIDALEQALGEAGLTTAEVQDPRSGLAAASGGSPFLLRHHLSTYEANQWRRGHPLDIVRSIAGTLNFNLAARYGIRGSSCGFVSACTSSSHALGHAFDQIMLGRQDRMLVVGAEECFVENVIPFDAMRALTTKANPDTACRPFDCDRDGFVVSGGAVAMILERASVVRGTPLARMIGWGQASDGYHVARPHPQGAGLEMAMRCALEASGVQASAVDYVNAHATSTPAGDRAEALALGRLFEAREATPAVVSTKGLTGHGLSLSGVMEAAFSVLSIQHQFVPGNRNLRRPDEACQGMRLPTQAEDAQVRLALNNASGFGGSNVCHIFAQV